MTRIRMQHKPEEQQTAVKTVSGFSAAAAPAAGFVRYVQIIQITKKIACFHVTVASASGLAGNRPSVSY